MAFFAVPRMGTVLTTRAFSWKSVHSRGIKSNIEPTPSLLAAVTLSPSHPCHLLNFFAAI